MCKGRLNPRLMQFLGREQQGGIPWQINIWPGGRGRNHGDQLLRDSVTPTPGTATPSSGTLPQSLRAFSARSPRVIAFRVVVQKLITTTNEICGYLQRNGHFGPR